MSNLPSDHDHITHVERPDFDDEALFAEMLCGASCFILDDGFTIPEGFDYYLFRDAQKASCLACQRIAAAMTLRAGNVVLAKDKVTP